MPICECGCKQELTGRQKRFKNDAHRAEWWSAVRKAGALGRGLDSLLSSKPKRIRCGNPNKSTRLMLTLNAIKSHGGWISTLAIQEKTRGVKVSTDVDDLRRAGYPVSKAHFSHTTLDQRKVYLYRWEGK